MRKFRSLGVLGARLLLAGSWLAASSSTQIAHAQSARSDRSQEVVFDDDLLNGDFAAPLGARVFPPHLPPARTLLIRPRTNFLAELYKSVEQL